MKNKPLFSFALFVACFMGVLAAQTQVAPFVNSHVQFANASGAAPCNGCLLDTFAAGTTTPLATYSESTGTTPNANPVVLLSDGSAVVYLTNASYKFRLRTAAGATIWTQDSVTWNNLATTLSSLTLTGNATINSSTAATNVANQSGPTFGFCGNYWTGAASASDCWNLNDVLGTGTNPTSTLTLVHSGSSGTPVFSVPALSASSATISGPVIATKYDGTVFLDGTTNTTLAQAITAAGSSGTIEIPPSAGTVSVGVNATIPAGVTLRIDKGAVLSIANAVTVTINGPFSTDGAYQVFSLTGTGTVAMSRSSASAAYVEWFGGAGDNSTDNTAALNAVINISNNAAAMPIQFLCGQYIFNSKPNSFGVGTYVTGCATGSTPANGTFLISNYNEASCASSTTCNGFLTWDGSFVVAGGTGGGLRNVTIYKAASKTAGAAIKLTGADDNHRAGWWRGDHVLVTGSQSPAGTFSYGWLVDGHSNTTAGTQGIRDNACTDCWFTNTSVADSSLYFINCAKCFWIGGELFQAGGAAGSAGATVTGTGGVAPSTADSVEVTLMGTISGDVAVDQASNVRIVSEHVLNNASFTSNTTNSNLLGRVDGTVTNSSTTSVMQIDGVSSTNNTLSNVGGPIGAVASGLVPPTQTAGALFTRTGAATGAIQFGDGSCFFSMTAASTFSFNCGNTGAFTIPGTTSFLKVPAIISTGTAAVLTGTGACATFSTQTGGSSAGRGTCTGTTGASTITITPGITATNGWVCSAFDQTTRANLLQQTATVAASCTLTATSISTSDVIVFSAVAF